MFYYIEGTVALLEPGMAVIDCGGVGYAINTTAHSLARLHLGEKTRLYIYTVIREDCFDLFGFATREEKHSFELLIGVSGVGPKAAQAILSSNSPEALSLAVVSGNEKALTVVPGIGKKIAQRILLELKDKLSKEMDGFVPSDSSFPENTAGNSSKMADAAAALGVLGYSASEISGVLRGMDIESLPVEEIVRQALRKMVK